MLAIQQWGGLGFERQSGLLVAVWPDGAIVRARSLRRPWEGHVAGRISAADLRRIKAVVETSPIWQVPSGGPGVDQDFELLTMVRGSVRRGWMETPGVGGTPHLGAVRRVALGLRVLEAARTNEDVTPEWACIAPEWGS
jgi:hypothetical protein